MSVNFYSDDDGHNLDGSCQFCNQAQINGFDESDVWTDSDDWDQQDDWDDGPAPEDDLCIEFAFDLERRQLLCVHTSGLWQLGIPELYIRPPQNFGTGTAMADARMAVFLATGLIHLGHSLIQAAGFDVPQHRAELDGKEVRFWLAGQEPPFEELAGNLGSAVDTVIKVDCSLWHEPLFSAD